MLTRLLNLIRPARTQTPSPASPARDWTAHFSALSRQGYNFRIDGDRLRLIAYPGLRASVGMPARSYDLRRIPLHSLPLDHKRTPART